MNSAKICSQHFSLQSKFAKICSSVSQKIGNPRNLTPAKISRHTAVSTAADKLFFCVSPKLWFEKRRVSKEDQLFVLLMSARGCCIRLLSVIIFSFTATTNGNNCFIRPLGQSTEILNKET